MGQTGYKVQLLAPACGIQEFAAIHKHMPTADTEPIFLDPCSCTNALIVAGQNYSCHSASDVLQIIIADSNLLASPRDAQGCMQDKLELSSSMTRRHNNIRADRRNNHEPHMHLYKRTTCNRRPISTQLWACLGTSKSDMQKLLLRMCKGPLSVASLPPMTMNSCKITTCLLSLNEQ